MSLSIIYHFINSYNLLPINAEPLNKSHQMVGVDSIPLSIIGTASPVIFVHSCDSGVD